LTATTDMLAQAILQLRERHRHALAAIAAGPRSRRGAAGPLTVWPALLGEEESRVCSIGIGMMMYDPRCGGTPSSAGGP